MSTASGDIRKTLLLSKPQGLTAYPSVCAAEMWTVPKTPWVDEKYFTVGKLTTTEPCTEKDAVYLMGPTVHGVIPLVFRNCDHNEEMAVWTRVGVSQIWQENAPQVEKQWKQTQRLWRRTEYWKKVRQAAFMIESGHLEKFLSTYPKWRRDELFRGHQESVGGILKSDLVTKAFVKMEVLAWTWGSKAQRKPRLIQGRHDKVTAVMGEYMTEQKAWYSHAFHREEEVAIAIGWTAEDAGEWYSRSADQGLITLEFDVSAWDTATSPFALAGWQSDCMQLRKNAEVLKVLEARQRILKGKTRRGLKYAKLGQVSSGDADTSLGNSVIHAKVWLSILSLYRRRNRSAPFHVAVMGDDSAVCVSPKDVEWFKSTVPMVFKNHGFKSTLENVSRSIYDAGFCSQRFVPVKGRWILAPKVGRVLAKTFWSLTNWGRQQPSYAKAVAQSLRNAGNGVPVLRVIIARILLKTEGRKAIAIPREEHRIRATLTHELSETSVEAFCETYGINSDELASLENELSTIDLHVPQVLTNPTLLKIVRRDIADEDV